MMMMDTALDHLVTAETQSDPGATDGPPLASVISADAPTTSTEESILDLSQRPTKDRKDAHRSMIIIDHWANDSKSLTCHYTDTIDDNDLHPVSVVKEENTFNLEQSLTDQLRKNSIREDSLSDSSHRNPSKLDLVPLAKKINSPTSRVVIHELELSCNPSPLPSSNFLWSTYLFLIGERSVSDEFFDHYLASIDSSLQIDMNLEYCYDLQRDLYWLAQIQLVSHCLILLRYVGLPDDDASHDFWANIYEQRCHPIGWCRENSKLMLPPPIVTKRAIHQQASNNPTVISNGNEPSLALVKGESDETQQILQSPPAYLFDKTIGLTPAEQLKCGMLLEIQDAARPWTLWFVRIVDNRGGRLHLRYVTNVNVNEDATGDSPDLHLFYLDHRVHPVGWTSTHQSIYSYEIPASLTFTSSKESIVELCLLQSTKQFLPPNVFKEQEELVPHRFSEGMKLEVFDHPSQNIYVARIGHIHNEYHFDVIIENDSDDRVAFVGHGTHPYLLPAHWAAEHKLILMKGKSIRQSEDYWNCYTEKYGLADIAPERCFNLITLNTTGNNRAEAGMKMEMVSAFNGQDTVFSVTLIHVADHLMWLRIDNTSAIHDERFFYHVLPINSLDVFPVGWAKYNHLDLVPPIRYQMEFRTYEQNRFDLFSSITHYPRIPRVFIDDVYLLTLYVNIRCFFGPHICSSRLARMPSKFGPGPYRHVLIDMFHFLLSASSINAHRALRRLDHQINSETKSNLKTEYIKAAKKSSKLIRPISIPDQPSLVHQYLRHICTQLEACPNLISTKHFDNHCPDKCHRLIQTFAFSTHSKHKRTGVAQLRAAQNRQRKQKSLLGHLKTNADISTLSSPVTEELPSTDNLADISPSAGTAPDIPLVPLSAGSDRQTRGFRVHIEPRTHTITRTNKKSKSANSSNTNVVEIKQEPIESQPALPETPAASSTSSQPLTSESKRRRSSKKKRSSSPSSAPSMTLNILPTSDVNPSSPSNKSKKQRRSLLSPSSSSSSSTKLDPSPDVTQPKIELQPTPASLMIRSSPYSISPPIDTRNPVTWNVNDVCWYLNEAGCSFALKTIKEQEIDGAALLLLDDLNTVQDLLEFKLGPAVKFFHVVEKLRSQVIETFHSSPSLKTTSRLSATTTTTTTRSSSSAS